MMETIPAKTIVQKPQKGGWFGAEYNMNIYRGCSHGCIYCDSRSECYQIKDFDAVKAKENALDTIKRDLESKRNTGVIMTGSMSDPYNPKEKEHELTRRALMLIRDNGFGVAIATKSALIIRDIDILSGIKARAPVLAKITITAADDSVSDIIEPNASPSSARFGAVRALSDAGIYCGVLLMPVLPFITDTEENIKRVVALSAESGAKFIYPAFGMTLRTGNREYFYSKLDVHFPGVKQKYIERFGQSYECGSPDAKRLWSTFAALCGKYGLLYKMSDIVGAYRRDEQKQLTLF